MSAHFRSSDHDHSSMVLYRPFNFNNQVLYKVHCTGIANLATHVRSHLHTTVNDGALSSLTHYRPTTSRKVRYIILRHNATCTAHVVRTIHLLRLALQEQTAPMDHYQLQLVLPVREEMSPPQVEEVPSPLQSIPLEVALEPHRNTMVYILYSSHA